MDIPTLSPEDRSLLSRAPVLGQGFDIPRPYWQSLRLLIASGELGQVDCFNVPKSIFLASLPRLYCLKHNGQRNFNPALLKVWRQNQEVCFNCLQKFESRRHKTRHHLLPKRFQLLEGYPTTMPQVHVHRQCTDLWHWEYDPHRADLTIWSPQEYIQAAQPVSFGYALYCTDPAVLNDPTIMISLDLLPFLLGGASFVDRPLMIKREDHKIPPLRLLRRNRYLQAGIRAQPPPWLRLFLPMENPTANMERKPLSQIMSTKHIQRLLILKHHF